jgi:thiamine-monophosphate kinase
MNNNDCISSIGEITLIRIIEELIFEKTGRKLIRDDSFFFKILERDILKISDLVVKGVNPQGVVISLGLPENLKVIDFKCLIEGIIDYGKLWNINYLGGDINKSKEIIINPTVFGFKDPKKIIYRKGLKPDDLVLINNKFGLTGVGFDIILNRKEKIEHFSKYSRAINSVLEPNDIGTEGIILANKQLATASIDSSDGLSKSLKDLLLSNPKMGFEIEFNDNLIHQDSIKYSKEYNVSLEKLVFNGGEEFIHLFTTNPKNLKMVQKSVNSKEKIYFLKEGKRIELKSQGYEHFK